jgi:hypothetical protein
MSKTFAGWVLMRPHTPAEMQRDVMPGIPAVGVGSTSRHNKEPEHRRMPHEATNPAR